jgi:hypothetical protein
MRSVHRAFQQFRILIAKRLREWGNRSSWNIDTHYRMTVRREIATVARKLR